MLWLQLHTCIDAQLLTALLNVNKVVSRKTVWNCAIIHTFDPLHCSSLFVTFLTLIHFCFIIRLFINTFLLFHLFPQNAPERRAE